MTKTLATQAAALALSALVTLVAFTSVGAIATHQHMASESVALQQAMTQTASLQNVVVIGRRTARA